jgi:hypothetical protein
MITRRRGRGGVLLGVQAVEDKILALLELSMLVVLLSEFASQTVLLV